MRQLLKRFGCFFVLIFCGLEALHAQLSNAKVDECFELTSIVCRLAGAGEYSQCRVSDYAQDIDNYFSQHTKHPLIAYYKEIRNERGISYNAISSMANVLEIYHGKVRIKKDCMLRNLPDTAELHNIDYRWTKKILNRYLSLLNDFYKKSDFKEFYNKHRPLYSVAESKMNAILQKIDPKWFETFYGQPFGNPQIYISLCNGPSNYALTSDKAHGGNEYGILIGCNADKNGTPSFNFASTYCTIIHEFAHNFSNPLADIFLPQMEQAISMIAPYVERQLAGAAYSPKAIAPEWLTRIVVLMYLKDKIPKYVPFMLNADGRAGFIWQQRTLHFMENFTQNRVQYEYFIDFIPQLIGFLNFSAREIDKIMAEYDNRRPYVLSVYPALDTQIDLKQEVIEFRITFSRPMNTNCEGLEILGNPELLTESDLPDNWVLSEWVADDTYVVRFTNTMIEKGKIKGFEIPCKMFQSANDISSLSDNFKVTFKTK